MVWVSDFEIRIGGERNKEGVEGYDRLYPVSAY